jgi:retinol dehydrogenase 12
MADFFKFLKDQLFFTPPDPTQDFTGQTVIVTGSNVGLGLEAARHITRLNAAKVILGVRDLRKGEEAKKSIEESTQRLNVLDVWQLDLSSYDSVKNFAIKVQELERLDVVVENAGIATADYRRFEDNEATITINVVSTFLLALLILPKLQETATRFHVQPHLVIVSSEVHALTSFPERNSANIFETLNNKETARMNDRYHP